MRPGLGHFGLDGFGRFGGVCHETGTHGGGVGSVRLDGIADLADDDRIARMGSSGFGVKLADHLNQGSFRSPRPVVGAALFPDHHAQFAAMGAAKHHAELLTAEGHGGVNAERAGRLSGKGWRGCGLGPWRQTASGQERTLRRERPRCRKQRGQVGVGSVEGGRTNRCYENGSRWESLQGNGIVAEGGTVEARSCSPANSSPPLDMASRNNLIASRLPQF